MSRFTRRSTMRALLTIAAEYALIAGAIAIAVAVPDTGWPVTDACHPRYRYTSVCAW